MTRTTDSHAFICIILSSVTLGIFFLLSWSKIPDCVQTLINSDICIVSILNNFFAYIYISGMIPIPAYNLIVIWLKRIIKLAVGFVFILLGVLPSFIWCYFLVINQTKQTPC